MSTQKQTEILSRNTTDKTPIVHNETGTDWQKKHDELLKAIEKIERRTRGADGTNQHPSGALRSIGAMAREAIKQDEN